MKPTTLPSDFCFTDAELAALDGRHISTIKRKILTGEITAFRVSERAYRITRENALRYLGLPAERSILLQVHYSQTQLASMFKCSIRTIQRAQNGASAFSLPDTVTRNDIYEFVERCRLYTPEYRETA